jgi:putative transposase
MQKRRIYYPDCPYHITCRMNRKEPFPLPLTEMWNLFNDYLFLMDRAYNIKIHAFVLMKNHYHLIASAPECNFPAAMANLNKNTSWWMNQLTGSLNHNWGKRYFATRIPNSWAYANVLKYVYRNPIKAGVALRVEDYPYSSITANHYSHTHLNFRIIEPNAYFTKHIPVNLYRWLNIKVESQINDLIQRTLTKSVFELKEIDRCPTKKLLIDKVY